MLFFNIDFFGFRARFWSLLGLQDGAKLASNRNFLNTHLAFLAILNSTWLKMSSWKASGSILEAQGLILEPLAFDSDPFWKGLGSIFRQKVGKKVFLTSRFGLVGSVLNSWRFGVRFCDVVTSQTKCRVCQKSQERQVPKSGQIVAKMWALIST